MLGRAENELLCRIGPGTAMGSLFRSYWLAVMHSHELERDGAPATIRILGEDLMAFRDTDGNIALTDWACPHRLAPLSIGRNEESGIRCLYHAWKFDVQGRCVDTPAEPARCKYEGAAEGDMPNEPHTSTFKEEVRLRAYATREQGDVVWAYLGDQDVIPGFPLYKWADVPSSHRLKAKWIQDTNSMQSLERGIDTSHASFLHRRFNAFTKATEQQGGDRTGLIGSLLWEDTAPRLEVEQTTYGFRYAAIRGPSRRSGVCTHAPHIMPCSSYPPRHLRREVIACGTAGSHATTRRAGHGTWSSMRNARWMQRK